MNDFVEVHHIVRRRWWILLVSILLAVLAGYTFTARQTKIFRATTSLIVGPAIQDTSLDRYNFEISQELAGVYADIAQRQPVLQAVVDMLQLDQSWQALRSQVRVSPVDATQLLEIAVDATSPEVATAIADEVARQLILVSPTALGEQSDDKADRFVRQRLNRLQGNIEAGQNRIDALEGSMSDYMGISLGQLRQRQDELQMLETLIATWESTYASLYNSLRGERSTNHLTVFEPAQTSTNPIRPLIKLNLLISAVIGFALGLGLIFLLEYADNTLRSVDEATELLRLPSLGAISRISGESAEDRLVASQDMFSSMAEDSRLLRSKLLFLSTEWPRKVFLVTSPAQAEGKSLVVANLGIAMANIGLRTVIVDANLRSPVQHLLFHLTQTDGLTEEIRSSQSQLTRRLKKSRIENLSVLTSGSLSLASPDRLATVRMTELFDMLAECADIILCDAPEAGTFADTPVLANKVNGVLLVVDAGHTRRESARQVVHELRQTGANVLGFVLNRATAQARTAGLTYLGPSVTVGAIVDERAPVEP
jgi:capsular exopolysaccharide synthesis family protein